MIVVVVVVVAAAVVVVLVDIGTSKPNRITNTVLVRGKKCHSRKTMNSVDTVGVPLPLHGFMPDTRGQACR